VEKAGLELRVARRLGVPMAKIIREGIEGRLKELGNNL
jgi:ribosomal protein L13E